jgi:hypothetical protein
MSSETITKMQGADIFLVNYMPEESHYPHLLKKLMKYVPYMPATLKALICYLPKGATYVDQYYAKRIQRMMSNKDNDCKAVILFIPFDSRKRVMKNFFKFEDINN